MKLKLILHQQHDILKITDENMTLTKDVKLKASKDTSKTYNHNKSYYF